MLEWYAKFSVCYVYLFNCQICPIQVNDNEEPLRMIDNVYSRMLRSSPSIVIAIDACTSTQIKACRWVRRGWTLQEFVASTDLVILDRFWSCIGCFNEEYNDMMRILSEATSIDRYILYHFKLGNQKTWYCTSSGRENIQGLGCNQSVVGLTKSYVSCRR